MIVPFLVQYLSSRLRSIKEEGGVKLSEALWGSRASRPFCPPFIVGKTPASMTFPEFQRADSNRET